jgi:hypothetical protein
MRPLKRGVIFCIECNMKLKLMGLFLIVVGFAIPFVLQKILPTFMYASVFVMLCFWVGFLLILSPFDNKNEINQRLKWARYAILFTLYLHLMNYFEVLRKTGYYTLRFFGFFTNPIENILRVIMPEPMVKLSDGTVLITQSFLRMLFTAFFSLVLYSFVGYYLKYIKDNKITSLFR